MEIKSNSIDGSPFSPGGEKKATTTTTGGLFPVVMQGKSGNSKVISGVLFVAVVAAVIASPDCYLTKIPSRIVPSVSEMSCE